MDITFVGSGDAFGSGGRFQTCIWVAADGYNTLVDCGSTSVTAMKARDLDPQAVDAVVVSHLHADHFGGLPFLVLDGQFARRTKPLTVLGPPGTKKRLAVLMDACYPGSTQVQRKFDVDVVEIDPGGAAADAGPVRVRGWQVDHPSGAPALAVRCDTVGRSFGYSGDTAWTPGLRDAAAGTDVFACEAYTYAKPAPYHLDYGEIHENAADFETGQLILTHMGPSVLARADTLELETAHDGLVLST